MTISHLGDISAEQFLHEYWQKKPLLIRGAFPVFRDFVSLESLRELAARDDVLSRLVVARDGEWSVAQGPLRASDLRGLKRAQWSLLVQGIDQLLPPGKALLQHFDFIPHARLDDLMVSFAPKGGGVGPHFDSYDVFLLQGQGHKLWQISAQTDTELIPDAPLRILQRFQPEQEWILGPGDMLYLPPRYAHHGVALNDCLTYSIGFRAPSAQELGTQFLSHLQERLDLSGMYADPDLQTQAHPAEISGAMLDKAAALINQIRWGREDIAEFLGCYLSEPKSHVFFDPPARPLGQAAFAAALAKRGLRLTLQTQALFGGNDFFINGEKLDMHGALRTPLLELADRRTLAPCALSGELLTVLHDWYLAGYVALGAKG
jgi:50S ribosomal protein L16 3-hydroxylase